jgi:ArsR family transcriptional regulator
MALNEAKQQSTVKILKALANPIRLKMIASLYEEPKNVYDLAKELNLAYPLAHLHLKSLKILNLVKEVREERKVEGMPTVKYYAPSDFELVLTPRSIRDLYTDKSGGEKNG